MFSGNIGDSVFSCRNVSRWSLGMGSIKAKSAIPVLDIFEISNVDVLVGSRYNEVHFALRGDPPSHVINRFNGPTSERKATSVPFDASKLAAMVVECSGEHKSRPSKDDQVFFNCPGSSCEPFAKLVKSDENKYCPAHTQWSTLSNATATATTDSSSPSSTNQSPIGLHNTRDLLVVFNSWGSTSAYHMLIDTVFPLWCTVETIANHGYITDKLTLINVSPICHNEQHNVTVQPIVEAFFGPHTYESAYGDISHTFGPTRPAHFNHAVFGFAYPWRPFRFNPDLAYNPQIGRLLSKFAHALTAKLLSSERHDSSADETERTGTAAAPLIGEQSLDMHNEDVNSSSADARTHPRLPHASAHGWTDWGTLSVAVIERSAKNERSIDSAVLVQHLQHEQLSVQVANFGNPPLQSWAQQATYSHNISVLVGVEGAGFVQQIFMRPGGLLVIIHCPKRDSRGNTGTRGQVQQWHAAIAQYLCHSVLNVVTSRCDQLTAQHYALIANGTRAMVQAHARAQAQPTPHCVEGFLDTITQSSFQVKPFPP